MSDNNTEGHNNSNESRNSIGKQKCRVYLRTFYKYCTPVFLLAIALVTSTIYDRYYRGPHGIDPNLEVYIADEDTSEHYLLRFALSKYPNRKAVDIGDDCFEMVKTFPIDGLNGLKTIKIDDNSFTQQKNCREQDKSKSFHIWNCESLESIEIGEYSFSDYAGDFSLSNLLQLQSIQICPPKIVSCNFCYSSLVI